MSGEIGNKGLLRSISEFLKIVGVKQLTSRLDMTRVVPVIDIGNVGENVPKYPYSEYELVEGDVGDGVGGVSQFTANLFTAEDTHDYRILALYVSLDQVNNAAADKPVSLRVFYVPGETEYPIFAFSNWCEIKSATPTFHELALGGYNYIAESSADEVRNQSRINWDRFLPAGCILNVEVKCDDGAANFPAATNLTIKGLAAKVPKGRLDIF